MGLEYQATGQKNLGILAKEQADFNVVDGANSSIYLFGACPAIHYQQPGGVLKLKTLESDSNYIKAALLLYDNTGNKSYLTKARAEYTAVRQYFLDPTCPYTPSTCSTTVHYVASSRAVSLPRSMAT